MDKEKMKKILCTMFDNKELEEILDFMNDWSYFEAPGRENCIDELGNYNKEEVVDTVISLIEQSSKQWSQDSFILNGYNGVYPFVNAKYNMFEPRLQTFSVNMQEVANNKVGKDKFNIGMYVKKDPNKPAFILLFAEPRNDGPRFFGWFIE